MTPFSPELSAQAVPSLLVQHLADAVLRFPLRLEVDMYRVVVELDAGAHLVLLSVEDEVLSCDIQARLPTGRRTIDVAVWPVADLPAWGAPVRHALEHYRFSHDCLYDALERALPAELAGWCPPWIGE